MRQTLQRVGLIGMVWTLVVIGLGFGLPDASPGLVFVSSTAAQFFLFWRLFVGRRWAAVGACLYCGWMVLTSFDAGIWQWTLTWLFLAGIMTALTAKGWKELRPGM